MSRISKLQFRTPLWALVLSLAFTCGALSQTNQPSGVLEFNGVKRAPDADLLVLKSGATLRGSILNRTFEIHSALGRITLEKSMLVGVVWHGSASKSLHTAYTVQRNRISGFIHDGVEWQGEDGVRQVFPSDEIRHAVFRLRPEESHQARNFISLNEGDFLSGVLGVPELRIPTPSGSRLLPLDQVESVRRVPGTTNFTAQLVRGPDESVLFGSNFVRIRLDLGGEVRVPLDRVAAWYQREGFVPLEARAHFTSGIGSGATKVAAPSQKVAEGLIWISPGRFVMGSRADEAGRTPDEDPPTEVVLTKGFWMGQREVTQGEFLSVMERNPSHFQGDTNRPVERVTWQEAREYCEKLTVRHREKQLVPAQFRYRLPTEAEWEYAARAGTNTRFSFGDDLDGLLLPAHAWFIDNSEAMTHPVGHRKANPWGLFDMHGNVWEWCEDLWSDVYPGGEVRDYAGPTTGWLRVARGGSWLFAGVYSRSANRDNYGPENRCSDIGFRVVLGQ